MKQKNLKIWSWIGLWCSSVRQLITHPIRFSKDYIRDFKERDIKGKIKKILLTVLITALSIFLIYQFLVWAFAFIFVSGMMGVPSREVARGRFIDKFGREPENDYELNHRRWY